MTNDSKSIKTHDVDEFYSKAAKDYDEQYDPEKIFLNREYPANLFRLRILERRIQKTGCKRIIDMGIGEGTPAVRLASLGVEICGFDYTSEMVEKARENFISQGLNQDRVIQANIEEIESFRSLLNYGPFDAVLCLGVMPHVEDDERVLTNIRSFLRKRGRAFISFRNPVFSLFTMNRFTHAFIVDELLAGVANDIRKSVSGDLKRRLEMDKPLKRLKSEEGGVGYDAILGRHHNPFEIPHLFMKNGFGSVALHWYHFHPAQPFLEGASVDPSHFRKAAVALEDRSDDWRGYFLCSAYMVEAVAT